MSSNHFRFKEFTIRQDKCAMKICTDSCLFGACIAHFIETNALKPKAVLDIGGGTGLLSLMLAQKSDTKIDSIEIDPEATAQMKVNFVESKWSNRLSAINSDILQFNSGTQYDFIISNPPFYQNHLRSADWQKILAKHDSGLTLEGLFSCISKMLSPEGKFAVMLPDFLHEISWKYCNGANLFIDQFIRIRHSENHPFFRMITIGHKGYSKASPSGKELTIHSGEKYSPEFYNLLKDYYLYL